MAQSKELTGPDLTQPFQKGALKSGQMLAGHAFGEPVLLARSGDKWFAVGAKCTHYGGPLAEGIMVGETVRCPWHHGCFNLNNGAAACAPPLTDLPCYKLEVGADSVRVTAKLNSGQHRSPAGGAPRALDAVPAAEVSTRYPPSVLIIGGGAAGNACAETLRREGYLGPITIVDRDPDAPYDRPNVSKDYLAGNAPEEWMPLHPPDFYKAQRIEILRAEVASVDIARRRVRLADGKELSFGALLLATGASPVRLNIPGADAIMYLRSLADCRALMEKTKTSKSAVVIGASFIGLEVAASLRARKLGVTVVAPDKLPLERVMGPELGQLVKKLHEAKGVTFRLGRSVKAIDGKRVILDDGAVLEADLVVAGIGVQPNVSLAEQAGLVLDKGVGVNEYLE